MAEARNQLDWPALLHEALTAPGQVGATYNRFYPYSYTNQMYLRLQGVREPVATYRRWQAVGRQVLAPRSKTSCGSNGRMGVWR